MGMTLKTAFSILTGVIPASRWLPGAAGAAKGKGGKGGPKQRAKGAPVTRTPDGKVDFGGPGVWGVPYVTNMEKASQWGGTDVEPPFRPFAKEIYDQRVANFAKDDPE